MTKIQQPDLSYIYYMHDKPTLAESQVVWKLTANAFGISTDGGTTYPYGLDVNGDAILNRIYAIGLDADYINAGTISAERITTGSMSADRVRTGKIYSNDGATLIDMEYGVANSDNLAFTRNVQNGFPLIMPFNIDSAVSKINSVLLKYTEQPFQSYSKTASSGGGISTTSGTATSVIKSSYTGGDVMTDGMTSNTMSIGGGSVSATAQSGGKFDDATGYATGSGLHSHALNIPNHVHLVDIPNHSHSLSGNHAHHFNWNHFHLVLDEGHSHSIYIPSHTHNLDFGIQEQAISNYAIDVYVDGILRVQITDSSANEQGIVDLTQWITTVGWHTIEIRSTTLKMISAQINIKSYIKS